MLQHTARPTFTSRIAYRDQRAAVEWLEKAFSFQTTTLATDSEGRVVYAEMRFGNGRLQIGSEWGDIKAPSSVAGANTQTISVELEDGIDAHCEGARAAGGQIIDEPKDQFHGDRTYRVVDPQGHIWCFSQHLRDVAVQEMEAAVPGMKVWRLDPQ
jgi:uncharacterized glyoxalase superfamily protein PhnB